MRSAVAPQGEGGRIPPSPPILKHCNKELIERNIFYVLNACDEYGGNRDRIKAFVLTMRYTGLRIADAIRLSKSQVTEGRVFELAEVKDGHSHRFRDTCAVELLLAGASVEDVASILGNTPHVVVKHYAPWVRERQERLEKLVRQSWR
jgi:integrase